MALYTRTFSFQDGSPADGGQVRSELDRLSKEIVPIEDGWTPAYEAWTYASADDPTYTFTITGDKTGKYSAGMRVKLTQTTVKYFIITAVSHSSGTTTVTLYGGTDYDLANAAIISPFYSPWKAPQGFPLDVTKWTQEASNTGNAAQAAVVGTWYNLGSTSLAIPIGSWMVSYNVCLECYRASTNASGTAWTTLSTANNSESDIGWSDLQRIDATSSTSPVSIIATHFRQRPLTLTSKTTYYLNTKTDAGSVTLTFYGASSYTYLRAVCAYL